jgi:hypothetical protein
MLCTSTAAAEVALGTLTAGEDNLEIGKDQLQTLQTKKKQHSGVLCYDTVRRNNTVG